MKIVRIIARLNVGGPAIHVVLLTHELSKRGHESLLVSGPVPDTEGDMEYYAAKWGVIPIRVPELIRPLSLRQDLAALWKIYRILRRERPDVVHTHTAKAGTLGRVAAILSRVPVTVHTFHGNVFEGYFSPLKTRIFLLIERMLARFTDCIITVSKSQREELIKKYRIAPSNRVEVVRLGLDLDAFTISEKIRGANEDREPRPLVIGWVGRMTEIKDPLFFVDFAAAMKAAGVAAQFLMIGDGPLRNMVEQRISQYKLQSDFALLGWQRDMAEIYPLIDFAALTSWNEGTPVTMIESMACGVPFIALNVGGLIDLMCGTPQISQGFSVFENGILVGPRDSGTFVRASLLLAQDRNRRISMGKIGRAFVLQRFSKERLARDIESLYTKLTVCQGTALPGRISEN